MNFCEEEDDDIYDDYNDELDVIIENLRIKDF